MPVVGNNSTNVQHNSENVATKQTRTSKVSRPRYGSTLSTRDPNIRGSKSSVSSIEETFYTADKDSGRHRKSKIYRNSNKPKENNAPVEVPAKPEPVAKVAATSASPELRQPEIVLIPDNLPVPVKSVADDEVQIIETFSTPAESKLPQGVLNILIDEGLYEYSREVYIYLKEQEKAHIISPDYIDTGNITSKMRMILVDWLIQVQHHLKLTQESLYLCVNILDSVLNKRDVDADKLQLVGITSMLMATKIEEYYPVEISKLLHLTEYSYSRREVINMERVLVQVLNFQSYIPTPQTFLLRFSRAALRCNDEQFYETCCYILDTSLIRPQHSCQAQSKTAAAATLMALLLYKCSSDYVGHPNQDDIWTPTLQHFSDYSVADLLSSSLEMANQLIEGIDDNCKFRGAHGKYSSFSQHKRLAQMNHLKERNLRIAVKVLNHWK